MGQISPFETIYGPFWTMDEVEYRLQPYLTRSEGRNRPSKGVPKMACFGPYFGPYFGGSWRVLGQGTEVLTTQRAIARDKQTNGAYPRSMDLRGPKPCTLGGSKMDLKRVIGRVGTRVPDTSKREVFVTIGAPRWQMGIPCLGGSRSSPKRGPRRTPFEAPKHPILTL